MAACNYELITPIVSKDLKPLVYAEPEIRQGRFGSTILSFENVVISECVKSDSDEFSNLLVKFQLENPKIRFTVHRNLAPEWTSEKFDFVITCFGEDGKISEIFHLDVTKSNSKEYRDLKVKNFFNYTTTGLILKNKYRRNPIWLTERNDIEILSESDVRYLQRRNYFHERRIIDSAKNDIRILYIAIDKGRKYLFKNVFNMFQRFDLYDDGPSRYYPFGDSESVDY